MSELPELFNHDKAYFVRFSEDMVGICEDAPDPKCAGAILCVFEYWTRVKLAHRSQAEIENAIAVKHGEEPSQDTSLWVYKTAEDLMAETLGLFGKMKMRENREWLVERRFLYTRNNPKYGWDRTLQFHLNIQETSHALAAWQKCRMHVPESASPCDENGTLIGSSQHNQCAENGTAIPETTTEKTTESSKGAGAPPAAPSSLPGSYDPNQGRRIPRPGKNSPEDEKPKDSEPVGDTDLQRYLSAQFGIRSWSAEMVEALLDPMRSSNDSITTRSAEDMFEEVDLFRAWLEEKFVPWFERNGSSKKRVAVMLRGAWDFWADYKSDPAGTRNGKPGRKKKKGTEALSNPNDPRWDDSNFDIR